MKFWLTCFVLLFAGAELFQWVVNLGGEGLSGAGLVLGGMGLAAASNAKHLPRLAATNTSVAKGLAEKTAPEASATKPSADKASATEQHTRQQAHPASHPAPDKTPPETTRTQPTAPASDQDSISFKVRLPWR